MLSVIPRKTLIVEFHSENLDAVSQQLFQKSSTTVFFLKFGDFFGNKHKEQLLVNTSESIKKKRYAGTTKESWSNNSSPCIENKVNY